MNDAMRRSLLRQPDNSFESQGPSSFQDHIGSGLCRLCCSDDSELRELFPGGYKEELLLRKIFNCTTVQISHVEDSDALICSACEGKIEDFFQYREQCRTNDVLHRKWKRRAPAVRSSPLIPVASIKCEPDDSEYFGPLELVPVDTLNDRNADANASYVSFDNSLGQPGHSSTNLEPPEQEDHNLLELMPPENSYESSGVNYDSRSDDDVNAADFQMRIKQEPEDIGDSYGWADMEDPDRSYGDTSMNSSGLIPVIEDTSVINAEVSEREPKRGFPKIEDSKTLSRSKGDDANGTEQDIPSTSSEQKLVKRCSDQKSGNGVKHLKFNFKMVKNSRHRTRLYADGHMFVRENTRLDGTITWRCRRNYDRCKATAEQLPDGTVSVFGKHDHVTLSRTERRRNSMGTFAYKFVPSARGNNALILGGYRYMKFYVRADGSTLWRCNHAPTCKAKASQEDDGKVYLRPVDVHNHEKTELPVAPEDVQHNRRLAKNGANGANAMSDGESKVVEFARTSFKPRLSAPANVPVKGTTKGALVKKRKDADYRIITNKKGFKALVYKGFRYCKVRVRQDGSIKWVCKINRKTCHAGLYQYPDGRLEWINATRHNHEATDAHEVSAVSEVPVEEASGPGDITKYHIDEETFTNSEWYFVRNKKNGTTLVHAGYRYNKKGDRSDKSSLWRCARACLGCRAGILMYPNETISKMDLVDHNHSPPPETEEPLVEDSLLPNGDGNEVVDHHTAGSGGGLFEEQDDPDANMRTLLNFTLGVSADDGVADSKTLLSRAEAGYRYIQNRRLTKSLLFRGYRYCRNNTRQDGSVQWTCQMNKKTCRASVKTFRNGSLLLININHNHDRLEEDEDEDDADNSASEEDVPENNNTTVDRKSANGEQLVVVADDSLRTAQDGPANSYGYYYAINRSNRECLIFQQCRYSKSSTRADGSVVWRCMMAGGTCPVTAIVHRDGSCTSTRDIGHKHPPLEVLPNAVRYPEPGRSPSSSKENVASPKVAVTNNSLLYKQYRWKKTKIAPDGVAQFQCAEATGCPAVVKVRLQQNGDMARILHETTPHKHDGGGSANETNSPAAQRNSFPGHDGTFQLYKTIRGQLTLVYDNYRFSFRNRQTDGTTSWKCRANKRCTARFYISKTGTMLPTEAQHLSHNHEQNGHMLRLGEPIRVNDADFSNFDDLVKQCFYEQQKPPPVQAPKTIKYGGHTYTMRTVKPSGREHWRCALFQSKACRAALFCRNNGRIVEHTNSLPHTHKPIVFRVLPSRPKAAAAPSKNTTTNTTTTVALYRPEAQMGLDAAGSRDFKFGGRNGRTIIFRKHRFHWHHQNRNGFTIYRCMRHNSARCAAMIKLDPSRSRIFAQTSAAHNHDPDYPEEVPTAQPLPLPSTSSSSLRPKKSRSQMFLMNAGPGLTDYHFERSSRGTRLCHAGYQYWSHNKLTSGWMVYRCRMQKLRCLAAGYFNPRKGQFHLRQDVTHNHAPPVEAAAGGEQEGIESPPVAGEQAESSKRSESPEETGITTDEYTFVRKKDGKISLSYAGSLYTFAGKREMANGDSCLIYNCYLEQCDASVELLPSSGLVHAVDQTHKRHTPPDLHQMEDLGRGSTSFRLVETSGGTAVLSFRGYRYYNNNLARTREDGSSRWYCQSTVSYERKDDGGKFRKRCFVPLMMLPNGRVSSQGTHEHAVSSGPVDEPIAHMIIDGQRFQFIRKLTNQSSVWRCAEHPSCNSTVYRLKNGKVQAPHPAHSHDDKLKASPPGTTPRMRILNGTTLSARVSDPAAAAASPVVPKIKLVVPRQTGSLAPVTTVRSVSMTQFEKAHGRRSYCYYGNRYYFYHTRSDGKQYWRCSARTNECKCRAGLLRLANDTIIPHNNEPHSHPDQMPGQTDPAIPNPPSVTETRTYTSAAGHVRKAKRKAHEQEEEKGTERKEQLTEQQQHMVELPAAANLKLEEKEPEAGGTFDYKIVDQHDSSDILLLEHRGLVYALANQLTDGGRVYRCKRKFCDFEKLLHSNGKLMSLSGGRHMCEDARLNDTETFEATATTKAERVPSSSSISPSADDSSFMFPCKTTVEEREIEDPEDFLAHDSRIDDDDDHIIPSVKRLRLTLHGTDPMEEEADEDEEEEEEEKDVAARDENTPDDGAAPVDDEQNSANEEDLSTSAWLDVEQEEIIDSSSSCDKDGEEEDGRPSSSSSSGPNKVSSEASHTPTQDDGEEEEGDGTTRRTMATPAAVTSSAAADPESDGKQPPVDTHQPHANSHANEEDESNDGSESHSKGGTKELVVSAEPHESYARKSSDKNVEDVSPSITSNDND